MSYKNVQTETQILDILQAKPNLRYLFLIDGDQALGCVSRLLEQPFTMLHSFSDYFHIIIFVGPKFGYTSLLDSMITTYTKFISFIQPFTQTGPVIKDICDLQLMITATRLDMFLDKSIMFVIVSSDKIFKNTIENLEHHGRQAYIVKSNNNLGAVLYRAFESEPDLVSKLPTFIASRVKLIEEEVKAYDIKEKEIKKESLVIGSIEPVVVKNETIKTELTEPIKKEEESIKTEPTEPVEIKSEEDLARNRVLTLISKLEVLCFKSKRARYLIEKEYIPDVIEALTKHKCDSIEQILDTNNDDCIKVTAISGILYDISIDQNTDEMLFLASEILTDKTRAISIVRDIIMKVDTVEDKIRRVVKRLFDKENTVPKNVFISACREDRFILLTVPKEKLTREPFLAKFGLRHVREKNLITRMTDTNCTLCSMYSFNHTDILCIKPLLDYMINRVKLEPKGVYISALLDDLKVEFPDYNIDLDLIMYHTYLSDAGIAYRTKNSRKMLYLNPELRYKTQFKVGDRVEYKKYNCIILHVNQLRKNVKQLVLQYDHQTIKCYDTEVEPLT